jgi:hypothetical protein
MATVLVSVALVAASIWIAIRMESGLDSPAGALYPAFTPGQAPAAPPVPARAGRRPWP